jgi:A/G-specific adenine glycosylase
VLARVFGIKKPIDTNDGKKYFTELANTLIDKKHPADYNQAIMDFGATVCTPKQPLCGSCPFAKRCVAKTKNAIAKFPVKLKKLTKKNRYFNYLVIKYNNQLYLNHRMENDIWKNLYDFPVIETTSFSGKNILQKSKKWKDWFKGLQPEIKNRSADFTQQLSHQAIFARFYTILINKSLDGKYDFHLTNKDKVSWHAFPKIILDYLKSISNFNY